MIKLLDILREIKVNNPNLIPLHKHPTASEQGYFIYEKIPKTVFFYDNENDTLYTDSEQAKNFILDKKIPYFEIDQPGNTIDFYIEDASKYFDFK